MIEDEFVQFSSDPAAAHLACAYAESWNTLDAEPFLRTISKITTYDSQMALDTLVGDAIREYFEGKMETFRESGEDHRVFAELGTRVGSSDPVVLIHHRKDGANRGLGERVAAVLFKAAKNGSCESVDLVMMGQFEGVGLFPGLSPEALEIARQYEPAPVDMNGFLDFYVVTMMSDDQPGQALTAIVQSILENVRDTRLHRIPVGHPLNHELMREGGFTGYPALVVRAGTRIVFKHQGVVPPFVLQLQLSRAIGEDRVASSSLFAGMLDEDAGASEDQSK